VHNLRAAPLKDIAARGRVRLMHLLGATSAPATEDLEWIAGWRTIVHRLRLTMAETGWVGVGPGHERAEPAVSGSNAKPQEGA